MNDVLLVKVIQSMDYLPAIKQCLSFTKSINLSLEFIQASTFAHWYNDEGRERIMENSFYSKDVLMIKLLLDFNFPSGKFDLILLQQHNFSEDFEPKVFLGWFDFTEHNDTKGTFPKTWTMIEVLFFRIG